MNVSGEFTLKFGKDRIREGNCRRLQQRDDAKVEKCKAEDYLDLEPELVEGKIEKDQEIQGLRVFVQASEMSDEAKLQFSYSVIKVEDESIDFQLLFKNPEEVSIYK